MARVPRLIKTMFWSCCFVSEGKAGKEGWEGRLEGKFGREGFRDIGREDWKGRLEGKIVKEG